MSELLTKLQTDESHRSFTNLINQIKTDGIEVIWDQIKDRIADRMFDEFGSLYHHKTDPVFTDLVNAGMDAELTDEELKAFSYSQKEISNSQASSSQVGSHPSSFFYGDSSNDNNLDNQKTREYTI